MENRDETTGSKSAVFVFDGTWNTFKTKSIMVDFYNESLGSERFYYQGSSTSGAEVYPTIEKALKDLCLGLSQNKFDRVFVTGLSRGAIAAVTFVNRANEQCGREVPFKWVGLVDPVNTTIYDLPTSMPKQGKIPCIHIHKERKWEHVLTTKVIDHCTSEIVALPKSHHELSFSPEVTKKLVTSAHSLTQGAIQFKSLTP
jgi:hypothetical protein